MKDAASSRSARDRALAWIGYAFLAFQVALVVHGLFTPGNHFAWAPHTVQVRMDLEVEVDGRTLTERRARQRYGLLYYPWEAHSIDNITALIRQHERTYGAGERATVVLRYRRNTNEPAVWRWSEP